MKQFIKQFPILKTFPPKINKQPQCCIDNLIKINNKKVSKFIDMHHGTINNNTDGYLIINSPHDFNTTVTRLLSYSRYDITTITTGKLNKEQIEDYNYNHFRLMNGFDLVFAYEIKTIIIKTLDDLKLIKEYIKANLIQYKTSSSTKLLSIVEKIVFQISRMLCISGKVKGLSDVFIKSKSIIVDDENDCLCWYRFIALTLYQSR